MNNKFDLVIFKPAAASKQDSLIGPRRIYSNNIYTHNINLANSCNFDFNSINQCRNSYTDLFHISSIDTPNTNTSSLSKL